MAAANPDKEALVRQLQACSDAELRDVLARVFQSRQPYPGEEAYNRNSFFLGIASSQLTSEPEDPERWGPYTLFAVANVDRDEYGGDPGPDWGFCQSGKCGGCGIDVCSNLRHGLCPICGAKVMMG